MEMNAMFSLLSFLYFAYIQGGETTSSTVIAIFINGGLLIASR